eukprot:5377448-Pleurochrysis_carterae.AAC.4
MAAVPARNGCRACPQWLPCLPAMAAVTARNGCGCETCSCPCTLLGSGLTALTAIASECPIHSEVITSECPNARYIRHLECVLISESAPPHPSMPRALSPRRSLHFTVTQSSTALPISSCHLVLLMTT